MDPSNIDNGLMNDGWNIQCQSNEYCEFDIHFETIDTICEYTYQYTSCGFLTLNPSIAPTQPPTQAPFISINTTLDSNINKSKHSEYSATVIALIITIIILIWIFLIFKFCVYSRIKRHMNINAETTKSNNKISDVSTTNLSEIELQQTDYGCAENKNNSTQINNNDDHLK